MATLAVNRLTLAVLLLLSACAAVDTPEACRITRVAELPIRMVGNFPLVEVQINDKPARLLLDTGAETIVVGEGAFARLGLEHDYTSSSFSIGLGARGANWPSQAVKVVLGTLALKPAPVLVAHVVWPLRGQDEVDGLLGSQALSAYDVDIDMAQGRLTLNEPRRCPNGPPPFAGHATTLHATGNRLYRLAIPLRVDRFDLSAIVDTGANRTFLDARRVGLTAEDLAKDRTGRATTADPVGLVVHLHRFSQAQVGGEKIENPTFVVGQPQEAAFDALLGSDYWRTHRVWLSYAGRTVTIGPPQPRSP